MILAALAAILTLATAPAMAGIPTEAWVDFGASSDNPPTSLQQILNNITVNPDAPHTDPGGIYDSSVNVNTDTILDSWDSYWMIGGQGQTAATLVIEIAGNAGSNSFGIYDATDYTKQVELFSGADTGGHQTVVSILLDGSVRVRFEDTGIDFAANAFGFYLGTTGGTYYSDTSLNPGELDQMRAYQGNGLDWIQIGMTQPGIWQTDTYVLAWEDLQTGADWDYNDMVVMVESITPVPVPGAVLLGVLGLGAAGMRLRKRQS
jgi:hypothetical protein